MMKNIKMLCIILINTFILLILIEVLLRSFFPKKNIVEASNIAYQYDVDYLISLKPNIRKEFVRSSKNGGDKIIWKTNQLGFRGDHLEKKELTIAVYGDSNIQARFSSLENTYPKKLEKYLQEKTQKTISVINGGVVGHGPDQSFLKLKKEKEYITPDIVVLNIFADNDYGDLLRNKLIKIDDNEELVFATSSKSQDPIFDTIKNKPYKWYHLRMKDAIRKLRDDLIGNPSLLPKNIIKTYYRVCLEEYDDYQNDSEKTYSNFADHYDIDIAIDPKSESATLKINLMEAILKKFKNYTRKNNIEFVILIQPSPIDINKNFLINYEDIASDFPEYKKDNLTSILQNICQKNNIKAINLFHSYTKDDPKKYYFIDKNNHWNDEGQDLAAKITSSYIVQEIIDKFHISSKK